MPNQYCHFLLIQLWKFYNEKAKTHSPRTVKYLHVLLHEGLKQAIAVNLIVRNVTEVLTLPKQTKKELRILSEYEQEAILDALKGERLYTLFLLENYTGMRRGEILALRWQDIDWRNKVINVRQTMDRIKDFDTGKTILMFNEPKTKNSKRQLPYNEIIENELLALYNKRICDLVFSTEKGTPIEPRNINRKLDKVLKKAGVEKATFHSLRHSFATRLMEKEVHPKIVQEILGHSSISVTLDIYTHCNNDLKRKALEKLNTGVATAYETCSRNERSEQVEQESQYKIAVSKEATTEESPESRFFTGAGGRNRTPDLLITSQLLYLLSYTSMKLYCFSVLNHSNSDF